MPKKHKGDNITAIRKAIRENCVGCMGGAQVPGYSTEVRNCSTRTCPLWPYRFGVSIAQAEGRGHDVIP